MKDISNNELIYHGCAIGMCNILIDGLHDLRYDLETCPGIAYDSELEKIYDTIELLREIKTRNIQKMKKYGLENNS